MHAGPYLQALYDRLGSPPLANFVPAQLAPHTLYQFGAFVLADHHGQVVLVRRMPIAQYPGIENYWWIPGGAREGDETLDETARREFREETGLTCAVERTLLAQLSGDRPFIAVFFRGRVVNGMVSPAGDPDAITAEAKAFRSVPFEKLWTDADKILLTREGFSTGPVGDLIEKNSLLPGNTGRE
jgi:8-oxo-dGTP pyrophosphatase MutT (NUDIX family)